MIHKIAIYGASGHGKVVRSIALNCDTEVAYFLDDDTTLRNFMGLPVVQSQEDEIPVIIAIGDNKIRKALSSKRNFTFTKALIDKTAIVRTSQSVGEGTLIAAAAVINPDAFIGKHVVINTAAVIEHDCIIKDYVHVSPNATLSGAVEVGEGTHIGSGAIIIPGIKIGQWCTIGAGSVVIRDVPDYATVVGNPARIIKTDE